MSRDSLDLAFRLLFCSIFIGLGAEHLLDDTLTRRLMPEWMPYPRIVSIFSGLVLATGGVLVALGCRLRLAACLLGGFLVLATALAHGPALFAPAPVASEEDAWIWVILQRSNFAKNLCLLGVCLLLWRYEPGRWSLASGRKTGGRL